MRNGVILIFCVALSCSLCGCAWSYPVTDWKDEPLADAPWVAPNQKAHWQTRQIQWMWGIFAIIAASYEHRWIDANGDELANPSAEAARYLLSTPLAKQWPEVRSEGRLPPHKKAPYAFALVALNPTVVTLWPDDGKVEYEQRSDLGCINLEVDIAYGVSSLPPVKGLMWFSPELKQGPIPVERIDETHARIGLARGELMLTWTKGSWRVARR